MGYRTDVAGIIKFKSLEDREKFVVLAKAHGGLIAQNFSDDAGFAEWTWDTDEIPYSEEPIMTFKYDDAYWRRSSDDVEAHYALCNFAGLTFGAAWRIVAVGENGDKDEYSGNNDDGDLDNYIQTKYSINTTF